MDNNFPVNNRNGKAIFSKRQVKNGVYHKVLTSRGRQPVRKYGADYNPKRGVNMYNDGSYGLNLQVVKEILPAEGVQTIVIYDPETDMSYVCSLQTWLENGITDKLGEHEPQSFLPRTMFEIKNGKV